MAHIRALTFDLWDTVFADDSDEPKRALRGLPPKRIARRVLLERALARHASIGRELVDCAYDTADAAFRHVWHKQHVTWTVAERLAVALAGLGRSLPDDELGALVHEHEAMELDPSPDLVPGAVEAIVRLSERYPLVVISDAIFSPGWALRQLLDRVGLLGCFRGFVFSDEVGCSKPAPEVFHRAAALVGASAEELVHIGDREHNDVLGPKAVGARAVLMTAAVDRGISSTRADAVCDRYDKLEALIAMLGRA